MSFSTWTVRSLPGRSPYSPTRLNAHRRLVDRLRARLHRCHQCVPFRTALLLLRSQDIFFALVRQYPRQVWQNHDLGHQGRAHGQTRERGRRPSALLLPGYLTHDRGVPRRARSPAGPALADGATAPRGRQARQPPAQARDPDRGRDGIEAA